MRDISALGYKPFGRWGMVISGEIQGACRGINRSWQWIKWKLGRGRQMLRLQSLLLDGWDWPTGEDTVGYDQVLKREWKDFTLFHSRMLRRLKRNPGTSTILLTHTLNASLVFCFLIMQLLYYK